MKILYHHRIASKDGQYVHVEELTNALVEQGHELCFVSPGFTTETDFGDDGGIATRLKRLLPKSIYELLELSYSFLIFYKLVRQVLKFKPDFIYERYNLYQPMGVVVSKIFGIPLLLEVNAPLVDERKKYSGLCLVWLANIVERFTWKNATKVLPVTQVLADIVSKSGVPDDKIVVIHNGINQHIHDTVFKVQKGSERDEIIIGFVGFITKWHRLDLAIKAISDFPNKNIKLICVGDGDIKQELEHQASSLNIADKVVFTGLKTREEVFEFVKEFDIALQPSVTPYASPLKLFEYLSSGSLVIAPRTDNICEILDDENSVLFNLDNFDDFSEKLHYAIENLHELDCRRKNARNKIISDGYTWQNNAARVINIADQAINDRIRN